MPYGEYLLLSFGSCVEELWRSCSLMLLDEKQIPVVPLIELADKYEQAMMSIMSVYSTMLRNALCRTLECMSRAKQITDWRKIQIHHALMLHGSFAHLVLLKLETEINTIADDNTCVVLAIIVNVYLQLVPFPCSRNKSLRRLLANMNEQQQILALYEMLNFMGSCESSAVGFCLVLDMLFLFESDWIKNLRMSKNWRNTTRASQKQGEIISDHACQCCDT